MPGSRRRWPLEAHLSLHSTASTLTRRPWPGLARKGVMENASLLFCLWAGLWCCWEATAASCIAAAVEAAATRCRRSGAEQRAARPRPARPGCRLSVVSMWVGERWKRLQVPEECRVGAAAPTLGAREQ